MKLVESGMAPGGIQRLRVCILLVLVMVPYHTVIVSAVIHKSAYDLQRMASGNDHRSSVDAGEAKRSVRVVHLPLEFSGNKFSNV
ncbi:cellobiose-specific PTS system IIC component [Anopheles sinensis]|uniref:Cellobiose-specific PTS system IIC component n=1 Tax=Anopheles sinensis TaxID=74873 RepID=A0A084VDV8_ANOSI|nr:cellobiose-specific PTS system IIC component [Anopheles sinensis]